MPDVLPTAAVQPRLAQTRPVQSLTVPPPGDGVPSDPVRLPVPEKFRDPRTGALRVEALLKSYLELERRLSSQAPASAGPEPAGQNRSDPTLPGPAVPEAAMPDPAVHDPAAHDLDRSDPAGLRQVAGVPELPDGYLIACDHGLFDPDPEINRRLFEAGYTPPQAQLLYDLAAERMVPLVQRFAAEVQADLQAEMRAEREVERLVSRFGGEERWREVSRQILAWAGNRLPAAVVEGLATTYDGVMALHAMMAGSEPLALSTVGDRAGSADGEAELRTLMRDPRYWRERDPAVIARVTQGFQRLYPGQG